MCRSLDESLVFDPTDLAEDVTPAAALRALGRGAHLRALLMALRLNDPQLVQHVVLRWGGWWCGGGGGGQRLGPMAWRQVPTGCPAGKLPWLCIQCVGMRTLECTRVPPPTLLL